MGNRGWSTLVKKATGGIEETGENSPWINCHLSKTFYCTQRYSWFNLIISNYTKFLFFLLGFENFIIKPPHHSFLNIVDSISSYRRPPSIFSKPGMINLFFRKLAVGTYFLIFYHFGITLEMSQWENIFTANKNLYLNLKKDLRFKKIDIHFEESNLISTVAWTLSLIKTWEFAVRLDTPVPELRTQGGLTGDSVP